MSNSIPYTVLATELRHRVLEHHVPSRDYCPGCRVVVCPRCTRLHPVDGTHTCPTPTKEDH